MVKIRPAEAGNGDEECWIEVEPGEEKRKVISFVVCLIVYVFFVSQYLNQ